MREGGIVRSFFRPLVIVRNQEIEIHYDPLKLKIKIKIKISDLGTLIPPFVISQIAFVQRSHWRSTGNVAAFPNRGDWQALEFQLGDASSHIFPASSASPQASSSQNQVWQEEGVLCYSDHGTTAKNTTAIRSVEQAVEWNEKLGTL